MIKYAFSASLFVGLVFLAGCGSSSVSTSTGTLDSFNQGAMGEVGELLTIYNQGKIQGTRESRRSDEV